MTDRTMLNGLTEAETCASASVAGLTTATKAGGAALPVVGYSDIRALQMNAGEGYPYEYLTLNPTHKRAEPLTLHAPAQATIDELRAEVERLTRQAENLSAEGQLAYEVSENVGRNAFHCAQDLLQKNIELRAEVIALKAKQIDVEAVMRLADAMADAAYNEACENDSGPGLPAAREALRASLLGDGGTLPADPYLQTR